MWGPSLAAGLTDHRTRVAAHVVSSNPNTFALDPGSGPMGPIWSVFLNHEILFLQGRLIFVFVCLSIACFA